MNKDLETILHACELAQLDSLATAIRRCVDEEANRLMAAQAWASGRRRLKSAVTDAESYYASEIIEVLCSDSEPEMPRPTQVLYMARVTNVWAIASLMRDAGLAGVFRGKMPED